jgi:hypothetical protein
MSAIPTAGKKFEDMFLQVLRNLEDSTGLKVSMHAVEARRSETADAAIELKDGNNRWRIYLDAKPRLTSHTLGSAIAALSETKKKYPNVALVAAYVNPSQADKLRKLGIEFLDAAGNVFVHQKGLHVFVTGRKPQTSRALERPARAFNPTGSRLVFALLCQPGLENKSYRELAREAGISLGAVNWIMNDLKTLGHLSESTGRDKRLLNRKELLKRWVSAYPEQLRPKLIFGRYRTEHPRDWWQEAQLPSEAFWGGEAAGKLITRYLKPQTITIYAESNLPKLQAKYGLRRDSKGDIELLRKFWKFDEWDQKHRHVTPPLLTYADLLSTADERNLETAHLIYDQYIARLVE